MYIHQFIVSHWALFQPYPGVNFIFRHFSEATCREQKRRMSLIAHMWQPDRFALAPI